MNDLSATALFIATGGQKSDNPNMSGPPLRGANIIAAGLTDVGRRRRHNEDFILLEPTLGLYLVLDGVGGRDAGDVASATAARSMSDFFQRSDDAAWPDGYRTLLDLTLPPAAQRLCAATRKANHDIRTLAAAHIGQTQKRKMSSTLVAAYIPPNTMTLHLVHVGDSRGYRLRADELQLLTRDHTLRNVAKLRLPSISEERLAEIPEHVITRALGARDNVELEVSSIAIEAGDTYLLCTDGLNHMVDDEQIREAMLLSEEPGEACDLLVALANEAGGRDNVSAAVLRIAS